MTTPTVDKYKEGDRVFAKLKGYPPWPALVKDRVPGKVESYTVFFYGTYENYKWQYRKDLKENIEVMEKLARVKPDSIYPYNDETKVRYGKLQRKVGFKEAMEEIETNMAIDAANEEMLPAELQTDDAMEEEEGELVIDESPAPPVLKKEGRLTPVLKKTVPKKEIKVLTTPTTEVPIVEVATQEEPTTPLPPTKQPRRGSKVSRKDSISQPTVATPPPEVVTPVVQKPEIVSRSGRVIKQKRFADDDIQFSSTGAGKPSPTTEESKSLEPTPAKRAKRVSSTGNKTQTAAASKAAIAEPKSPLPPLPTLERPKLVAARTLKKKSTQNTGTPATSRPPPPLLRAMPNLIPAPSPPISTETPTPTPVSKVVEEVPEKLEEIEEAKIEKTEEPKEEPKQIEHKTENEESQVSSKVEEDSSNPLTPENTDLKPDGEDTDDEGTEKENNIQDEDRLTNYENGVAEDSDESHSVPTKMKVDLKSGTASVVLSFNHERPNFYRNDLASVEYDMATARSVLQTKTQLEVNETAFLKTIADSIEAKDGKKEINARLRTEQIQKKVMQLRMEGEVIEIIGELVGSLGMKYALCDRALDLLEKLTNRTDINTLALKKHPEVVEVIRKVQNYHGNAETWGFGQTQLDDFNMKAELIREKATSIYQSFKYLFCTTPGKSFYDTFTEEIEKFNDSVSGISESAVLGLFDEPPQKSITENQVLEENNRNGTTLMNENDEKSLMESESS